VASQSGFEDFCTFCYFCRWQNIINAVCVYNFCIICFHSSRASTTRAIPASSPPTHSRPAPCQPSSITSLATTASRSCRDRGLCLSLVSSLPRTWQTVMSKGEALFAQEESDTFFPRDLAKTFEIGVVAAMFIAVLSSRSTRRQIFRDFFSPCGSCVIEFFSYHFSLASNQRSECTHTLPCIEKPSEALLSSDV